MSWRRLKGEWTETGVPGIGLVETVGIEIVGGCEGTERGDLGGKGIGALGAQVMEVGEGE